MLGGEHLRERFSERAEHLQNQPKHRGYLPGTHLRTGDGGGYGSHTLQGNWVEERRDAGYYDGKPALPTDLDRTWQSTYSHMTTSATAKLKQISSAPLDQTTMIEVVDGAHRAFPGHQFQVDPARDALKQETFLSTTMTTFHNPAETRAKHQEQVPLVKAGIPGAQGKAVTLRIRHRLLQLTSGGNLIANFRRHLIAADTSRQGFINANELQRGCQSSGVPLDDVETSVMIRSLDRTGNGLALIDEIVNSVRGEFTERRSSLVEKAFLLLLKVCSGVVRFRAMVDLFDAVYHPDAQAKKITSDEARKLFAAQFDVRSDDEVIEKSEFVRCYADWSIEMPSDLTFEIFVRNSWHLSGGEGKCENTSCRRVQVVHTNGRVTKQEVRDDLGIGADMTKIKSTLEHQGIRDIAKIEFLQ